MTRSISAMLLAITILVANHSARAQQPITVLFELDWSELAEEQSQAERLQSEQQIPNMIVMQNGRLAGLFQDGAQIIPELGSSTIDIGIPNLREFPLYSMIIDPKESSIYVDVEYPVLSTLFENELSFVLERVSGKDFVFDTTTELTITLPADPYLSLVYYASKIDGGINIETEVAVLHRSEDSEILPPFGGGPDESYVYSANVKMSWYQRFLPWNVLRAEPREPLRVISSPPKHKFGSGDFRKIVPRRHCILPERPGKTCSYECRACVRVGSR